MSFNTYLLLILLTFLGRLHECSEHLDPCSDDYPEICGARVAAGDCVGGHKHETQVSLRAMVNCRASCREYFRNNPEHVTDAVKVMGGAENMIRDMFGVEVDICSLEDGLNRDMRYSLLRHLLVAERQKSWVPAFTNQGFLVKDIPASLFGMIKMARVRIEESPEVCFPKIAAINCQVKDERCCTHVVNNKLFRSLLKMMKMNVLLVEMREPS